MKLLTLDLLAFGVLMALYALSPWIGVAALASGFSYTLTVMAGKADVALRPVELIREEGAKDGGRPHRTGAGAGRR